MSQKQKITHPDDVETIVTDWTTAKVLCGPDVDGSEQMGAVALFFEPGQGHSRHIHHDADQIIYVVSGRGEHVAERADGTSVTEKVAAGSLIFIPKGHYHSTFNTGWEPMRVLAVFSPAAPVQALRAVGDSGGVGTAEMRIVPAGVTPARK
ncbi:MULTISPECIES: cupin domain-containing protein [Ramlibacter]|uniref:Cupin domain-containing protein n=1 Tax=Ramlibacter aquaticus TaxID=2780094 RepID=A0ABR9SKV5_9BURK|nr:MULTISPECIES: cupin domain-containing protein [Ramlibacter]MBE7942667.1 cupin domain-containing protein [Ramlibacter aquaticus]